MTWPITVDPLFGCWKWTGKVDSNGYPIVWRGPRPVKAYLIVYEAEVGKVPDGKVLGHRCLVRACVRPSHLQPVSKGDNEREKLWRVRVRKFVCPKGHDAAQRIVTMYGGIVCRTCNREGST